MFEVNITWTNKNPAQMLREQGARATFSQVEKGVAFEYNGNIWAKKSNKTASGIWPACLPEWAYFRPGETVHFASDSYCHEVQS